jgi:hypothetical protein
MKNTIIPAGYRLSVVSWENDADAYQTRVFEGLTKERAEFLIEVAELSRGDFGNLYEPSDKELDELAKAALALFKKFPGQSGFVPRATEYADLEEARDCFSDLHFTLCGSSEHFYTRVTESWKVEYVPHEIVLENVSNQFRQPGDGY